MKNNLIAQTKKDRKAELQAAKQSFEAISASEKQKAEVAKKDKQQVLDNLKTEQNERKANIKKFKTEKARDEHINKIKASWEYKRDSLVHTSKIDIIKYKYKTDLWNAKNSEKISIVKTLRRYNLKLADSEQIKNQIKEESTKTLEALKPNREEVKRITTQYKRDLAIAKLEKKEIYKKEQLTGKGIAIATSPKIAKLEAKKSKIDTKFSKKLAISSK